MKLYGTRYCDFVVWRKESTIWQRIPLDVQFISEAVAKIPSFIKSCILPERGLQNQQSLQVMKILILLWIYKNSIFYKIMHTTRTWFTKPTEPSSDEDPDIAVDIESEDRHFPDTVHCITVDGEVFEDRTASTSTNIINDDTVTDSGPIDSDFDSTLLQVDAVTSNQQETSHISDDATESSVPAKATLWCYCQQDKPEQSLVGCDNPACQIEWFHLSCLHLTVEQLPRGKWFCPECHKSRSQRKNYQVNFASLRFIMYVAKLLFDCMH